MAQYGIAPNPLGQQDAFALVYMLAGLEGALLAGDLPSEVVASLTDDVRRARLVDPDAGPAELRLALANLNQRIRYTLGEYDQPPAPDTGEVDQHFGFASLVDAQAFVASAMARSERAHPPVAVDGRAYDGEVSWQVAVQTAELPLSAEFDRHAAQLRALAAEHGGTHGGWQSAPG